MCHTSVPTSCSRPEAEPGEKGLAPRLTAATTSCLRQPLAVRPGVRGSASGSSGFPSLHSASIRLISRSIAPSTKSEKVRILSL